MTNHDPLPISGGRELYTECDRQQLHPDTPVGPPLPTDTQRKVLQYHHAVFPRQDQRGCYYEVLTHRRSLVRDDRCIRAFFRTEEEARASANDLANVWAMCFGDEAGGASRPGVTPCPN